MLATQAAKCPDNYRLVTTTKVIPPTSPNSLLCGRPTPAPGECSLQYRILLAAALLVLACLPALAVPVIQAERVAAPPAIDGVLDDSCWQGREKMTGFANSDHGGPALVDTEAMICRDEDNLYIAFICHDPQPSAISSIQKQRNGDLSSDDFVGILVDPDNTMLDHYHFEVNPAGTQWQSIPEGAAGNITWRGDWRAGAKVTDSGWCAELAIPFRALRYPPGQHTFGFSLRRYVPRLDDRTRWPDLGTVLDQTRFAQLTGLELPKVVSRPVFMPYIVSSTQPGRSFTNVGFDYKHLLAGNVTALATFNPDFTDVQDSVASVSYSYTERSLPEYRPFFQEGSALFPDSLMFYSRRIGDIDGGVKAFGTVGRQSFAFMDALKSGEGNHFAGKYMYDLSPDLGFSLAAAGSMLQGGDPAEPDTSMCISPGLVKRWRGSSGITTMTCRQYRSINSDGGPGGSALRFQIDTDSVPKAIGYTLGYARTDSDYYVRDAYIPTTGIRGFYGSLGVMDKPSTGKYSYWNAHVDWNRYWAEDDSVHHQDLTLYTELHTKSEWAVYTAIGGGEWLGRTDATKGLRIGWLERHLYGNGSLSYTFGKREGRDYSEIGADQSLRITPKLSVSCGYGWARLGAPGATQTNSQVTLLGNYELSPEQSLGVWLVGRDSNVNVCCTFRRTVRSGSDIYLIYGYPNTLTTEKRLAIKVVSPMVW